MTMHSLLQIVCVAVAVVIASHARAAEARLMPAVPTPPSLVDDHVSSGSAEQMFGAKQQIPPAEQGD
jgi:hypothetical protein